MDELENKIEVTNEENSNSELPSDEVNQVSKVLEETKEAVEEVKEIVANNIVELEGLRKVAEKEESEKDTLIKQLEEANKNLQEALQKANSEKEALEAKLQEIEEENLLSERLTKLSEKNLLRKGEEAQAKQAEKIKIMTNEEFDEYLNELSEISTNISTEVESKVEINNETINLVINKVKEALTKENISASEVEISEGVKGILSDLGSKEQQPQDQVEEIKEGAEAPLKESASFNNPTLEILALGFSEMLKRENRY